MSNTRPEADNNTRGVNKPLITVDRGKQTTIPSRGTEFPPAKRIKALRMLETVELRSVVNSAFQSSQSNTESHRALCLNMKAAHIEALRHGDGMQFQNHFVRCLDRLLTTSRKDQCANRVVEFVATYAKMICPEEAEENEDANDEFEMFVEFIEAVIERYLPGFESRFTQVRFRCVSLVGTLVPLAPLNEDLLSVLEKKAIDRLRDSDSRVRVQAVILVSRFDLNEVTTQALSLAMQHDPSAEVRLVATFNIAHGSKALTELACERVRDSGSQIRRGLYSKVLRTIDFRALSIKARENIVRAGLNDRDESVKRAASMLVASRWVNMSDNNIELVLQRLDVIGHTDIAEMVLNAFFELRKDVVEQLEFGDEFWSELWIEDTVLLRGFQEFCMKEQLGELLYDRMPELTTLAGEIERLWKKYIDPATYENVTTVEEAEDLRECLPFMVEQLLQVASRYDLDDEASRQRITSVISDIVMAEDAPSSQTIEHILAIQRRLNASDTALVSWAFEMLEAMPSLATQASDEALIVSLLRALSLFNAVLCRVSSHDVAAYLPSLYSTYIAPALESPVTEIRTPALRCLGLACLLDSRFAKEHVSQFVEFLTKNGPALLRPVYIEDDKPEDALVQEAVLSIGAMTDMLLVHVDSELPSEAVAKLWVSFLKSNSSAVQGSAALSLAKLVLSNLLEDPLSILPRIVIFYFENTTGIEDDDTQALTQQQLTLFLRAYCLFDEGKEAMANVFGTVFEQFAAYKSAQKTTVTIGDLVNQILELTIHEPSNQNRPKLRPEEIDEDIPSSWHHAHAQIAYDLVRLLLALDDAAKRRSLTSCLSKVMLEDAPIQSFRKILNTLGTRESLEEIRTPGVRHALLAFQTMLHETVEKMSAPSTAFTPSSSLAPEEPISSQPASTERMAEEPVREEHLMEERPMEERPMEERPMEERPMEEPLPEEPMTPNAMIVDPDDMVSV